MAEILKRLDGVPEKEIQKTVYSMVRKGVLATIGAKRNRSYELAEKKINQE